MWHSMYYQVHAARELQIFNRFGNSITPRIDRTENIQVIVTPSQRAGDTPSKWAPPWYSSTSASYQPFFSWPTLFSVIHPGESWHFQLQCACFISAFLKVSHGYAQIRASQNFCGCFASIRDFLYMTRPLLLDHIQISANNRLL